MKYENLTKFDDIEFKRLVGVTRPLFSKMILVLEEAERLKKKSGRPHSLVLEDQLLLTLSTYALIVLSLNWLLRLQ